MASIRYATLRDVRCLRRRHHFCFVIENLVSLNLELDVLRQVKIGMFNLTKKLFPSDNSFRFI
jgi:hypothetical protein